MAKGKRASWAEVVEVWRRVRVESRRVEQVAAEERLTVTEVERRVQRIDAWLAQRAEDAGEPQPGLAISQLVHALRLAWMAQEAREGLAKSRVQVTRREVKRHSGAGWEEKVTVKVRMSETPSRQEREMLRRADEWQARAEEFVASLSSFQPPPGQRPPGARSN